MGDCIYYDFLDGQEPALIEKSVHKEHNRKRDLSGHNALLSDHFYYFGEDAKYLPTGLHPIIKRNQGHRVITRNDLVSAFERWISQFDRNRIYADPQLRWKFENISPDEMASNCASCHFEDDEDESEDVIR
jgi:hypothetical protein